MKPCEDCSLFEMYQLDEADGGGCATSYCCSKYIEWQVDVAFQQESDPQEERGLVYQIDDREV